MPPAFFICYKKAEVSGLRFYHKLMLSFIVVGIFAAGAVKIGQGDFKKAVYVWKETEKRKLPIYCVDTKEKVLSLTFDVAWGNEDMNEILKILKEEKIHASFFFSGDWVERFPKDVENVYRAGHDIGNHGDRHQYMTKLSKKEQQEEIAGAHQKVKGILGYSMDLFRPPYGDYNAQVIQTAEEMGYYGIQWNLDSLDWMEPGAEGVIQKICSHKDLGPGGIILLHTGTKCTRYALKPLIRKLKKKGYAFVPVSKLIYRKNFRIDPAGKQRKY